LDKNPDIISMLNFYSTDQVRDKLYSLKTDNRGYLTWEEFLDFFLSTTVDENDENPWWKKVLKEEEEKKAVPIVDNTDKLKTDAFEKQMLNEKGEPRFEGLETAQEKALRLLSDTRVQRVSSNVQAEIENHQQRALNTKSSKRILETEQIEEVGDDDLFNHKCENLLLPSHMSILEEIYQNLDKFEDAILKRSEYIMALRTDPKVVEFIDADAVGIPHLRKKLNLDEVLREIEQDETMEISSNQYHGEPINHKEYITWREFVEYFDDYKPAEQRNKNRRNVQETRK